MTSDIFGWKGLKVAPRFPKPSTERMFCAHDGKRVGSYLAHWTISSAATTPPATIVFDPARHDHAASQLWQLYW